MTREPTGKLVNCPECAVTTTAIVPKDSEVVDDEGEADGKVAVTCHECGCQFTVYYRDRG